MNSDKSFNYHWEHYKRTRSLSELTIREIAQDLYLKGYDCGVEAERDKREATEEETE